LKKVFFPRGGKTTITAMIFFFFLHYGLNWVLNLLFSE